MKRIKAPTIILNGILILLSLVMVAPFMWILSTSLRLPNESFKLPPSFFPTSFHWQNYRDVFTVFPFFDCILNSVKVAFFSVGFNLIVSTMAGYAFARIPFKGRSFVFVTFLAGMMVPVQATLIPTYILLSKIGLVGSHWSLILPAIISPLNIFFIRQYMMTIPGSYEEAAYIDGASRFRIYVQIFVPMSTSVIIMTSLLTFLATWNSFLQPLVYLSKWEMMTLPLGLKTLNGMRNTGSVSVVLAGVTISLVVPTLLYSFGHKYILQGSVMSGLKS
jgi:multiple sugar transport system permease protein